METINILSLEEIRKGLEDKKLHIVSKYTGVSYPTIKKLKDGKDRNFTLHTLKRISEYLTK